AFTRFEWIERITERREDGLNGPLERLVAAVARCGLELRLGSAFAAVRGVAGSEGALGHRYLLRGSWDPGRIIRTRCTRGSPRDVSCPRGARTPPGCPGASTLRPGHLAGFSGRISPSPRW